MYNYNSYALSRLCGENISFIIFEPEKWQVKSVILATISETKQNFTLYFVSFHFE